MAQALSTFANDAYVTPAVAIAVLIIGAVALRAFIRRMDEVDSYR
jgi:hypothetical protein